MKHEQEKSREGVVEEEMLPELCSFIDYRAYLNAVLGSEGRSRAGLSMSKFADALNMSRSALSMVLGGSRDLTIPAIHKFARALRLNSADHSYFEALVLMCQSETPEERSYYDRKLDAERQSRRTHGITTSSRTLVSEWFIPALLVYLIDVSDSPERWGAIAAKLGVTELHVRNVVAALESEGFLAFKGQGNVHITFNRVVAMISSQQYMKAAMMEAFRQVERHFDSSRHFFATHAFSLQEQDIKAFIEEFKALVDKYIGSTPASGTSQEPVVVQLCAQLFPVL